MKRRVNVPWLRPCNEVFCFILAGLFSFYGLHIRIHVYLKKRVKILNKTNSSLLSAYFVSSPSFWMFPSMFSISISFLLCHFGGAYRRFPSLVGIFSEPVVCPSLFPMYPWTISCSRYVSFSISDENIDTSMRSYEFSMTRRRVQSLCRALFTMCPIIYDYQFKNPHRRYQCTRRRIRCAQLIFVIYRNSYENVRICMYSSFPCPL